MNIIVAPLLLSLVTAQGTVVGRVVYPDAPETARQLPVRINRAVCGKKPIFAEDLLVAPDGGLAHAVVHVDGATEVSDAAPPETPHLEQKGCVFGPHVQSATRGAILDIGNSDAVIHNVHALIEGRTIFNLAMPIPGIRVKRTLTQTGVMSIRCDSGHDWMSAYILVFSHALHSTSDRNGAFRIEGVPVGHHRIRAWHERLGERTVEVEVKDGEATQVEISFGPNDPPVTAEPPAKPPTAAPPAVEASPPARAQQAAARAFARGTFLRHCAPCHGVDGDGRGETTRFLASHPRDFRTGSYMFRTTASGRVATEEDLMRTIAHGMPGSDMPAFRGRLDRDTLRGLARYLMTLSPRFQSESPGPILEIPPPPPVTPAILEAGRELYGHLRCAQCHGPRGDGEDADQVDLEDDWGHPIAATDLTRGIYKGGAHPRALYRTLSTGLDGTPMPSFADMLSPQDRWALVHYVMSLRRGGLGRYLLEQ